MSKVSNIKTFDSRLNYVYKLMKQDERVKYKIKSRNIKHRLTTRFSSSFGHFDVAEEILEV